MAVRVKKGKGKDSSFRDMKADYYPVQRQVNLAGNSAGTVHVLDVGRTLSVCNHRLYRQGKTYQLKIDIDNRANATSGPAQYEVYALADTWYVQKAWQLARATYLTATAGERSMMSKQKIARWEDFRVTAGVAGVTILPKQYSESLGSANNASGEFQNTAMTLADGSTTRTFTWGSTPSASEWSMLQEYDTAGSTDDSPDNADAGNPYQGVDGDVHEAQMDIIADRGNSPPYNADSFSDNVWVKVATLDNSGAGNPGGPTGHSRMSTGFFNAPCGLVVIKSSISHTLAGDISMTVKSGQYKGVAAMNMGA
jgi:hypothetical protein